MSFQLTNVSYINLYACGQSYFVELQLSAKGKERLWVVPRSTLNLVYYYMIAFVFLTVFFPVPFLSFCSPSSDRRRLTYLGPETHGDSTCKTSTLLLIFTFVY